MAEHVLGYPVLHEEPLAAVISARRAWAELCRRLADAGDLEAVARQRLAEHGIVWSPAAFFEHLLPEVEVRAAVGPLPFPARLSFEIDGPVLVHDPALAPEELDVVLMRALRLLVQRVDGARLGEAICVFDERRWRLMTLPDMASATPRAQLARLLWIDERTDYVGPDMSPEVVFDLDWLDEVAEDLLWEAAIEADVAIEQLLAEILEEVIWGKWLRAGAHRAELFALIDASPLLDADAFPAPLRAWLAFGAAFRGVPRSDLIAAFAVAAAE